MAELALGDELTRLQGSWFHPELSNLSCWGVAEGEKASSKSKACIARHSSYLRLSSRIPAWILGFKGRSTSKQTRDVISHC